MITPKIDSTWTLFLDRDGVINKRLPGRYVQSWEEFEFIEGSLEAIVQLSPLFYKTVVVTNQQGIGKGLMTHEDLHEVHQQMQTSILKAGGKIDQCYYSPFLKTENPPCRKPNTGMALQAQNDFPLIDFTKSIMVGDSISDMEFGERLGMTTIFIEGKEEEQNANHLLKVNARFTSLAAFAKFIT